MQIYSTLGTDGEDWRFNTNRQEKRKEGQPRRESRDPQLCLFAAAAAASSSSSSLSFFLDNPIRFNLLCFSPQSHHYLYSLLIE